MGPYNLEGRDYSDQAWFKEVLDRGVYISDVFLGYRQVPHIVIALKHEMPDGSFYVLRAALDTGRFNDLLSRLEMSGPGDAFIINRKGTLQTPSSYHGKILEKTSLSIPRYSPKTEVIASKNSDGESLIVGYAYIPGTSFILMIVMQKRKLMKPLDETRTDLIWLMVASITIILLVILGVATYLVRKIHEADQKRIMTLHQVEYSNKMASIGRLAAGAAHDINNPLAIINEKAGLIKDMFTLREDYVKDQKLIGLVNSVLSAVERCGGITKRLLNFARHIDVSIQPVDLGKIIRDVLSLHGKEAEYRSIAISVNVPEDIPQIESDRGTLQQIFLNLINYAFEAMNDGGNLGITVKRKVKEFISVTFTDDGHGIPAADLDRVFAPFFSNKAKKVGTGLGLSITYGLVQEIGGSIRVQSESGKGTSFIVTLPLKIEKKEILDI